MSVFEDNVKQYKRFLKDNGVYKRALDIHCNGTYSEPKNFKFPDCLKNILITNWIQDSVCFCVWTTTKEGDLFWWALSILWQQQIYLGEDYFVYNIYIASVIENFLRDTDSFLRYYKETSGPNKKMTINICKKIENNKIKLKEKLKEYGKREEDYESPF